MIRLVRAFHRHADVVGLGFGEGREVDAEFFQVEACDLFVEDLRERIDDTAFVLDAGDGLLALGIEPEVDLSDGLVREGGTHHEARVAGSAAEVEQAAFGEHEDAVAVGEIHSSYCGLISLRLMPGIFLRPAMSISLSKWPMLPTMARCFILLICAALMMPVLPVVVTKMSA